MVKLLYAYRELQLALFYRLPNKSKSDTNAHFQHLSVKEPYSYKTVPYCSLTSVYQQFSYLLHCIIILSKKYWLPLPVGLFVKLRYPTPSSLAE